MTDEPPNERLYTNGRQKCRCRRGAVYVRMSKIVFYENPYIVTGDIQHTGSKGSLRVYVKTVTVLVPEIGTTAAVDGAKEICATETFIGTWKGRNMERIAPL